MDRRTIIATAGAITLTVVAGSTAIAANVGILGNGSKAPVGQLSPIVNLDTPSTTARAERAEAAAASTSTLPPQVETIYVDQYVQATPKSAVPPSDASAATVPPAAEPAGSEGFDGGEGDDPPASTAPGSAYEDPENPEDPGSAYEGAEDDD